MPPRPRSLAAWPELEAIDYRRRRAQRPMPRAAPRRKARQKRRRGFQPAAVGQALPPLKTQGASRSGRRCWFGRAVISSGLTDDRLRQLILSSSFAMEG